MQKKEPLRACLLSLREMILAQDQAVSAAWKYRMPFFCYQGKMFCYLWVHKKTGQPYLGIVEGQSVHHPGLVAEKRARMKIMCFDAAKDLPAKAINNILKQALDLYRSGIIPIN